MACTNRSRARTYTRHPILRLGLEWEVREQLGDRRGKPRPLIKAGDRDGHIMR